MLAYRQCGVQQQHALLRPLLQVTAQRGPEPHIVRQFLEDVDERLGEGHAVLHGEAQPVRLPVLMVGILPDDDDLDLVKGGAVEGIEDAWPRRKDAVVPLLFLQKGLELCEIWRLKLIP